MRATNECRQQQQRADALSSEAMVPAVTVREAQAVRGRMLRVLEYYFDDDGDVGPRLAAIRSGSGLQDLEQLADLYGEDDVHSVISKDVKHWRKDDVASARRLAQSIFRGLGLGSTGDAAQCAVIGELEAETVDTGPERIEREVLVPVGGVAGLVHVDVTRVRRIDLSVGCAE